MGEIVFFKSVNIWQSYKQERGCLVHFAHLTNTLLKDEESARDDHVLACNYTKCLPSARSYRPRYVRTPVAAGRARCVRCALTD